MNDITHEDSATNSFRNSKYGTFCSRIQGFTAFVYRTLNNIRPTQKTLSLQDSKNKY